MFASRFLLLAFPLVLGGFGLVPGVSNAKPEFFTTVTVDNKTCSSAGCHNASPVTCNGCHAHGTRSTILSGAMNLVATTLKSSYAPGDDISVTLSGGSSQVGSATGWVRVNVYDSNGTPLVSNTECLHNAASYPTTCSLPVTLKTRAVAGMTSLYVGWVGNEYDPGGTVGAPIASGIAVGKRAASQAQHVEEIVRTNTFSVTDSTPTPTSAASGGGSLDWMLTFGLIGLSFLRRKLSR